MNRQIIKVSYDILPAMIIRTKRNLGYSNPCTNKKECEYFRFSLEPLFESYDITVIYDNLYVDGDKFEILADNNIYLKNGTPEAILSVVGCQSLKALTILLNDTLIGEILIDYSKELIKEQQDNIKYLKQKLKTK